MKKIRLFLVCVFVLISLSIGTLASNVHYLPGVTKEMTFPEYWSDDKALLMTFEEITEQNKKTIADKSTYMYDLENFAEEVDGVALNEALITSTTADVKYYLGWTYIESDKMATMEMYDEFIANTQNPEPLKHQPVKYAVAVKRTALFSFPSEKAVWDSPSDPETDYQYLVGVRVNEPLVITSVSKDGKFYYAKSICCSGWVRSREAKRS